ncbi:hypothetical protein LBMAG20_18450 [Methylocystaceae bacterium]|nr:hypothetical protein LBMAG20_18450 [Methylocystaceae bacterium]
MLKPFRRYRGIKGLLGGEENSGKIQIDDAMVREQLQLIETYFEFLKEGANIVGGPMAMEAKEREVFLEKEQSLFRTFSELIKLLSDIQCELTKSQIITIAHSLVFDTTYLARYAPSNSHVSGFEKTIEAKIAGKASGKVKTQQAIRDWRGPTLILAQEFLATKEGARRRVTHGDIEKHIRENFKGKALPQSRQILKVISRWFREGQLQTKNTP